MLATSNLAKSARDTFKRITGNNPHVRQYIATAAPAVSNMPKAARTPRSLMRLTGNEMVNCVDASPSGKPMLDCDFTPDPARVNAPYPRKKPQSQKESARIREVRFLVVVIDKKADQQIDERG
jgi:hypothetical protein